MKNSAIHITKKAWGCISGAIEDEAEAKQRIKTVIKEAKLNQSSWAHLFAIDNELFLSTSYGTVRVSSHILSWDWTEQNEAGHKAGNNKTGHYLPPGV